MNLNKLLAALDADKRQHYVNVIAGLMRPGGRILLVSNSYKEPLKPGTLAPYRYSTSFIVTVPYYAI